MEEKLTIKQVLEITAGILEGIEVPMKYMDSIGYPVSNAIRNLKICIDAQNQADKEAAEKAKAEAAKAEAAEMESAEESEG
jgi:hypothetical protein